MTKDEKIAEVMELVDRYSIAEHDYYQSLSIDVGVDSAANKSADVEQELRNKLCELIKDDE